MTTVNIDDSGMIGAHLSTLVDEADKITDSITALARVQYLAILEGRDRTEREDEIRTRLERYIRNDLGIGND